MKIRIEIFAKLTNDNEYSLVFFANKEFKTEEKIMQFSLKIMRELDLIYEERIAMKVIISIEPIEIDMSHLRKPKEKY